MTNDASVALGQPHGNERPVPEHAPPLEFSGLHAGKGGAARHEFAPDTSHDNSSE